MSKVAVELKKSKIHKSCVRYESAAEDAKKVVTNIYLNNDAVKKLGTPESVRVTIESI